MSWFWEVLKIEPTTKIYQVKKAYVDQVRQLKNQEVKGELQPDAYQKLTDAEQAAIAFIEGQTNQLERKTEKINQKDVQRTSERQDRGTVPKVKDTLMPEKELKEEVNQDKKGQSKLPAITVTEVPIEEKVDSKEFIRELEQLLKDWPEKIQKSSWQKLLASYKKDITQELQTYQQLLLPFLADELIYLPKTVLFYLYEEFEMDQLELTSTKNWYYDISELPDFSFEIVLYLPEEEAYSYFETRYQLFLLVSRKDWQSHSFEIKKLLEKFTQNPDWLQGQSLLDQDIENLAAVFVIKENLEKVVTNRESLTAIEKHLLPLNSNLATEKNQTAVFLRTVFTVFLTKKITPKESTTLKNSSEVYLEADLKVLLIGLAFYAVNDQEQAKKYFSQIKGSSAQLVKPLVTKNSFSPQLLQKKAIPLKKLPQMSNLSPAILIRFVVLAAIGISLLGNIFGNQEEDFSMYEDEFEETDQYGEDLSYPDTIEGEFYEYFLREAYRSDREIRQTEFIESYVPNELKELFVNYQRDYYIADEGRTDNSWRDEIIKSHQAEEQVDFLFLTDNQADVILILNDSAVEGVFGTRWENLGRDKWDELVAKITVAPQIIVSALIENYLAIDDWERDMELYNLVGLVNNELMEDLEFTSYQFVADDLIDGTYQISQKLTKEPVILINNQEKELLLVVELDQYGRASKLVDDIEFEYESNELATMIKKAESAIPLMIIE